MDKLFFAVLIGFIGGLAAGGAAYHLWLRAGNIPHRALRQLLDDAPFAVVKFDRQEHFCYANPIAEQLFGKSADELHGQSVKSVVPTDVQDRIGQLVHIASIGGTYRQLHSNLVSQRSGSSLVTYWPLRARNGAVQGVMGSAAYLPELQQLNQRAQRQASLMAAISDAVIAIDSTADYRITDWNAAAEKLYGYTAAEAIGQPIGDLLRTERSSQAQQEAADSLAEHRTWRGTLHRYHRSGKRLSVNITYSPLFDEEPQRDGLIEIDRDETDAAALRETLSHSENRFRTLFETLRIGVMVHDTNGQILLANSAALAMFRASPEDVLGKSSRDMQRHIMLHEDLSPFEAEMHPVPQAIGSRQPVRNVLMGIGASAADPNEGRWLLVNAEPELDGNGNVTQVICTFSDISETRRAQRALKDSQASFRQLFASNPLPMWVFDRETLRFLDVNEAAVLKYGYSRAEFLAMTVHPLRPPEDIPSFLEAFHQNKDKPTLGEVWRHRLKSGQIIDVEISGHPLEFNGWQARLVVAQDVTERITAQRTLRDSEERFRALLENSSDMISMLDENGAITYISPSVTRILGYALEDYQGKSPFDFIDPNEVDRMATYVAQGQNVTELNIRVYHKNGGWRDVEYTSAFLLDNPSVRGVVINARDVTERTRIEKALRESEERFRILIDNNPSMISIINAEAIIHYVSPAVERVLGYMPEELLGKSHIQFLHPDDAADVLSRRSNPAGMRFNVPLLLRMRHKNGEWRFIEAISTNALDVPGINGIIVNSTDVTQRVHSEKQLRDSEVRLRMLIENNAAVISIVDAQGLTKYVSPSVEHILGYKPEEMIGKDSFTFAHPDDVAKVRARFPDQSPGIIDKPLVFRLRHKDGSWRYMETLSRNALDVPGINGLIVNGMDVTERVRTEKALRETNDQLEALIESAPMAIVALDLDGRVTLWNPEAQHLFGWQQSEVLGTYNPIVPKDDLLEFNRINQQVLNGKAFSQLEVSRLSQDGTLIEVNLSTALLRTADGHVRGTIATMTDISALKQTQRQLQQRNEYLTALYETLLALVNHLNTEGLIEAILIRVGMLLDTPNGFLYLVDPNGSSLSLRVGTGFYKDLIRYAMARGEGVVGSVWETGQTVTVSDYAHWAGRLPDSRFDQMYALLATPLKSGSQVIGVVGLTRFEHGRDFTPDEIALFNQFVVIASVVFDNAQLYTAAQQELAERKRAEEQLLQLNAELEMRVERRTRALEQGQAQLRAVLDAMGEGLIYSEDARIVLVNRAMAELTHYDAEALIGQPITIFRSARAPDPINHLHEHFTTPDTTWRGEVYWRRQDGSEFDAALTLRLIDSRDDKAPVGTVTVVRDVTAEKQLQSQKQAFIAHASHELRTPLTNFKTRLFLMSRQPQRVAEHLAVLERVAERMTNLVEDLLDVSQFERGVIALRHEPVTLQRLINDVIELQQPEAHQKKIHLLTDLPDSSITLWADPGRINQVIVNLVVNAINYTAEGGRVSVQLEQTHDQAVIRVTDTGSGIAPENLTRIFEPFFRANEGSARGTGLGLSISREIVTLHGGTLTVESMPGEGSTFCVRLPCDG